MRKPREPRTEPVGIRITKSLKAAVDKAAADDHRSVASIIEIALVAYLRAKGYVKK